MRKTTDKATLMYNKPQSMGVPKSAVRTDGSTSFVLVVNNGKVERRAVKVGFDRGTDVGVMGGVIPGDSLIVKGPENLRDGDKVEIHQ